MTEGLAALAGSTFRQDSNKLTDLVARHLLREEVSDRRTDCIHPSAASHNDWCTRATYYEISGAPKSPLPRSVMMESVFETGHEAHNKYQNWFWDMGRLRGVFECLWCGLKWEDWSPYECPRCETGRQLLRYREVPLQNRAYLLAGNADGDVLGDDGWVLIEIKTIGPGTVRYDAPELLERYSYVHTDEQGRTHSGVDWDALWNGIRRPFGSHLRQGMIYCFLMKRKQIRYIYEPKFKTAHPKEFVVQFRSDVIEEILRKCSLVAVALDKGRPPKRPVWAEKTHSTCKRCPYRKECWDAKRSQPASAGTAQAGEVLPPPKARVRYAPVAEGHY